MFTFHRKRLLTLLGSCCNPYSPLRFAEALRPSYPLTCRCTRCTADDSIQSFQKPYQKDWQPPGGQKHVLVSHARVIGAAHFHLVSERRLVVRIAQKRESVTASGRVVEMKPRHHDVDVFGLRLDVDFGTRDDGHCRTRQTVVNTVKKSGHGFFEYLRDSSATACSLTQQNDPSRWTGNRHRWHEKLTLTLVFDISSVGVRQSVARSKIRFDCLPKNENYFYGEQRKNRPSRRDR